jgi:hypothetical protein
MIRANLPFGWALAALLTLGSSAGVAAGLDRVSNDGSDALSRDQLSRPSASPDLSGVPGRDQRSVRILVSDGTGVAPGVRLQPVGGGQDFVTTDANGIVDLQVPRQLKTLSFLVIDDSGAYWTVEETLATGQDLPTDVVIELGPADQPATMSLFSPKMFNMQELDRLRESILGGRELLPSDQELAGPTGREHLATRLELDGRDGSLARYIRDSDRDSAGDADPGLHSADRSDSSSGTRRFTPRRSLGSDPVAMAWSGETEFNDTPGECNPIDAADFGVPLAGQNISSFGDNDWYCFEANCGDVIEFSAVATDGTGFRPRLEMYFDDGTPGGAALRRNFGSGFDNPTVLTEVAPLTTTYWVLVRRGSSSFPSSYPYNYELRVDVTPGTCPVDPGEPVWGLDDEPNCNTILVPMAPDSYDESRAITWHGYRPFPNVLHQKDKDIYCISLDCGERLDVTVTPTGDMTLQPEVRFIAPQNMSCAGCTPSAFYDSAIADAPGEVFTAGVEAAVAGGIWRVEISARDDSNNPTIGTYDVSFSRSEGFDCAVDEPNDSSEDCLEIVEGERMPATMFPETEDDWFCFNVPACGLRVAAQAVNPVGQYQTDPYDNAEVTLALFGPDDQMLGAQLSSNSDGYMGAAQFVSTAPGLYKVRVRGTRNVVGPENPGYFPTPTITGEYEMLLTMVDAKTELELEVSAVENPADTVLSAEALANLPIVPDVAPGPGATFLTGFMSATSPNPTGSGTQTIPMPFPFEYFGEAKASLNINQDGWMSFSDTFAGHIPIVIPSDKSPNDAMFVFRTGGVQPQLEPTPPWPEPRVYTDMRKSYEVLGSAPNRELVVTWSNMTYGVQGNPTGDVNFSASLFEGSNCIEYRYGVMDGLRYSEGQRGLVGLENADGSLGVNSSSFEPKIKPGMSIRYCPDGGGGYTETVTEADTVLSAYPDPASSCEYDISVDSAPFVDISASGTEVSTWAEGNLVVNPDCPYAGNFFFEWLCFEEPLVSTFPPSVLLDPADNYALVSLPFPFPYHGVMETDALIFLDGFIAFDAISPFDDILSDGANKCGNPEWDRMNGKVMPFWDDLRFTESGFGSDIVWDGAVYTQLDGVAPSRTFTVQWTGISTAPPFGPPPPNSRTTFQLVLHEDGRIDFHYAGPDGGEAGAWHRATGSSATVGLEDREGRSQTIYWCNDSGGDFGDNWDPGGPAVSDRLVSFTPAAQSVSHAWNDADTGELLGTDSELVIPVAADMPCGVQLAVTARDPNQCCNTVETQDFVTDRWPPEVVVDLATDCLWSPNHKMFTMMLGSELNIEAVDNCTGTTVELVSCESNEPSNGWGDGNTEDDCVLIDGGVQLRSERSGRLDGRIYSIGYEASDENGNVTTGTIEILVPHDQSEVDCPKLK